jgi:hypothetical protein
MTMWYLHLRTCTCMTEISTHQDMYMYDWDIYTSGHVHVWLRYLHIRTCICMTEISTPQDMYMYDWDIYTSGDIHVWLRYLHIRTCTCMTEISTPQSGHVQVWRTYLDIKHLFYIIFCYFYFCGAELTTQITSYAVFESKQFLRKIKRIPWIHKKSYIIINHKNNNKVIEFTQLHPRSFDNNILTVLSSFCSRWITKSEK